ncbi:hypothetical protein Tco_0448869 [Tanacetum coccineum]
MCDKKNSDLFTNTECVALSPDFKLTDESYVLLKVSRKDNMYSVDLKNVVPQGGLTCLFAKAILEESNLWHRRLGHVRSRGSDFDIPVVFSLVIALLRNKVRIFLIPTPLTIIMIYALLRSFRYWYRYSYLIIKVSHDIFLSIFDYLCDLLHLL